MIYFGCVVGPGHYFWDEHLNRLGLGTKVVGLPWREVDGQLTPQNRWTEQGMAALHHKDSREGPWTALAIWDYTVDHRPGSNVVFFHQGTVDFAGMVEQINLRPRMKAMWDRIGRVTLMQEDDVLIPRGLGAPEVVVVERSLLEEIGELLEDELADPETVLPESRARPILDRLAAVLRG